MAGKAKVEPRDREFFQWVSNAAFANPFSEERYDLDMKIAGQFRNEAERAEFLSRAVSDRVQKWKPKAMRLSTATPAVSAM